MKNASVLAFLLAVAAGCVGCGSSGGTVSERDGRLVVRSDRAGAPIVGDETPATIGGDAVTWDELLPVLSEIAGGEALEELAFDRLLGREAERRGIVITEADMRREEALLAETIGQAAGADASTTERLLLDVRRARNLGPARYAALLKRTAILRELVAGEVHITNAAVEQMHQIRHGERYRARIITVSSERTAEDVRRRLLGGEAFGELAAEISTDSSAERGGVIGAISAADPTYPSGLRAALRTLDPGAVSPIIALDGVYAVVRVDERIGPDGVALETVRGELERAVRLRQERLAMNERGRRLLAGARVTVFDPALSRSWRNRNAR